MEYLLSRTEQGVCLSSTRNCGEYLLPYFFGATEEMVYILCLDGKRKALGVRKVSEGSIHAADINIRRIAEEAMKAEQEVLTIVEQKIG